MLFPASYRLDSKQIYISLDSECLLSVFYKDDEECYQFFMEINSEEYAAKKAKNPFVFLKKAGSGQHLSTGISLVDDNEEKSLRDIYQNGTECGVHNDTWVIQRYISNPLLLDQQNKFEIRTHMLIASVDPLIVYYHDGFIRTSLDSFDPQSLEVKPQQYYTISFKKNPHV